MFRYSGDGLVVLGFWVLKKNLRPQGFGGLPRTGRGHMARTLVEIVPIGRPGTETFS
jgi:hypothetical protein